MRNYLKLLKGNKGFTLIELLVVIGILGILAAVLLTVLDPLEQLARGRDAGRITAVAQLSHAVVAYYTTNSNVYPAVAPGWQTTLVTAGEVKTLATNPAYSANGTSTFLCGGADTGNYCYNQNTTDAIIYVQAESKSSLAKAGGTVPCAAQNQTWIVWDSLDGRTGLLCNNGVPAIASAPFGTALK